MPRWVLLLHRLPPPHSPSPPDDQGRGREHHDWLLEAVDGAAGLISFRVPPDSVESAAGIGPGLAGCVEFTARRLGEHRAAYLDYEGAVSDGRGTVERVLSGVCRGRIESTDRFEVEIAGGVGGKLGTVWQRWVGERAGDVWTFNLHSQRS